MLPTCNVFKTLSVSLMITKIQQNVKSKTLVDNLLICVRLFVILKVLQLHVFHSYVPEMDSKIINYVIKLKNVNLYQNVTIQFGCLMIHLKEKIVVQIQFVEINVED